MKKIVTFLAILACVALVSVMDLNADRNRGRSGRSHRHGRGYYNRGYFGMGYGGPYWYGPCWGPGCWGYPYYSYGVQPGFSFSIGF